MNRQKQTNQKAPVAGKLQTLNGKTMMAAVLVAVMAILWGRVLLKGKGGPAEVSAEQLTQLQTAALQPDQAAARLVPVRLEVLRGRHDVLAADMFSTDGMAVFDVVEPEPEPVKQPDPEPQPPAEPDYRAQLEKVAAGLKLEAVIRDADGRPRQVYVNDAIYTVGSVLTVNEGPDQYELVLKGITENEAMFVWNNVSITLKMTETVQK